MGPTLDHLRAAEAREADLSAITGVLRGKLKVRGDKAKALRLSSVINFPKAR